MRIQSLLLLLALTPPCLRAGTIATSQDADTGWKIYTLRQGETQVRVVPDAGANGYSIEHQGIEYLRVPEDLARLRGVWFGNPILYPMPNRVRGAKFTFAGKAYEFPANGRGNFIHGLVHSESFEVVATATDEDSAQLTCALRFQPGGRPYKLFPWRHVFRVTIRVEDGSVRWTYEVDNQEDERDLPFGVALHPYFVYQKSRAQTFLQVPATHLMESTGQLPSGRLLDLDGQALDARQPRSLEDYNADDVFFGMRPDQPARVAFRDVERSISFGASPEFTHLVVYTPDRPFFCIENQTCSTDAHNLAAEGKRDVAHLQICSPGVVKSGFVEYRIK